MCKEEIIRLYEKRFKKLSKHYNKLLKDFDREEIHLFRLELKKLRAFTRLVTHAMFRDHFKIHGQIKAFYNAAGDLRNIQLHLERVSEISRIVAIELPAAYLQLLLVEEIKAQKNLRHQT